MLFLLNMQGVFNKKNLQKLLQVFETSTVEYDEFETFIGEMGDVKQIKRTKLYDQYCAYCRANILKPQTRFWFGKQIRLSKNIRVYKLNGYEYLDIFGINGKEGEING